MPYFNSSAIKRAEYDPATLRLTIWFPEDGPYDFCKVPQLVWEGLCNARSKGTYYNDFIRDKYDY